MVIYINNQAFLNFLLLNGRQKMNPERNRALYHALVLTDRKPENTLGFETHLDNQIRDSFGRSVFIQYQHNVGRSINHISDCIEYVDVLFHHPIGEHESFEVKSLNLDNINTLVISWKNKARYRETLNFLHKSPEAILE